ncbi:MAG: 50S ribosomal protein L29 [Candidatus Amoebophilus sp.]|uniref:Large ribosomal subunit protein uL29 n=1 Tax=Amoebophilus asiaticus (strain 5a2) TaxID=452471 RepID=RL29_AMOA5|nr:50S ribosomal protein L29 [Candidatus Amoebophilus asiaticus]B3EUL5.1 RecName: Full=Large ribosomal subunit protein uL29; AltName: Full=50S ribosomal protein L29 [Candidatus Amoebophilus asiaticus 5a2]ACE05634.1 ribosomal protein L29 [Candidatus Amoebophilus asiaticus 5a2]
MKYAEISSLAIEELKEKIKIEQENLRKLKFAHTISPIENPTKIKNTRRLIARLETALNVKGS